ncbi:MAG: hypothetical protein K9N09_06140 [Candidatus Cloacimonetes bacterium]|nr:hypothetical protein [Candidatus Cloacimonadota bacterium]MCF7813826.1 hypothetical protein [Candidatus Cloacimonadota bacterium]MCF7868264.1 hypothetical protein [Candidatus Cloacimonadota bacterium]MCF7883762.1 hypothetical protein [Candidatus Cloacimonadota bacterium]
MKKGIFCLEGLWYDDLRRRSTVKPILELLELNSDIPFLHSDCATKEEFDFYITKWKKHEYDGYPILYLAFHGLENGVLINDLPYTLEEMSNILEKKCRHRVIVFASCSTIRTDRRNLKRFLKKTRALAICGYRKEVPWIQATAFELMLLAAMQENALDGRGIEAIGKRINATAKMFTDLDFLMLTNKEI